MTSLAPETHDCTRRGLYTAPGSGSDRTASGPIVSFASMTNSEQPTREAYSMALTTG